MKHPKAEEVDLIDVMHALSDPTRVEIILTLARKGKAMTCGELVLDRPKSSMSHHFKILRAAGLVRTEIKGTEHINSLRLAELEERFPAVLSSILKSLSPPESPARGADQRTLKTIPAHAGLHDSANRRIPRESMHVA